MQRKVIGNKKQAVVIHELKMSVRGSKAGVVHSLTVFAI